MKNHNEVIDNVFRRRGEYISERKRKKGQEIKVTVCAVSFCLLSVIGFGTFRALTPNKPVNKNEASTSTKTKSVASSVKAEPIYSDIKDSLGWIVYKGKIYIQNADMNGKKMDVDRCIGKASDFKGNYQGENGNVYTVKAKPNYLYIKLSNGGSVALDKENEYN